ncbi:MAG TPA: hypothetical protein VF067_01315 [Sphingomicrobium sp.]
MNTVSRLSDHLEGKRSGAPVEVQIEDLVDHVSRAIAEVQSLLLCKAAVRKAQDAASQVEVPLHPGNPALHIIGGADMQLNVRTAKKLRNLRKKMFGEDLFSGPAWSILLELFESYMLQRTDTVGQVCVSAELPGATALRWLAKLRDEGFVRLRDDHLDRRRRFAELSEEGVQMMTQYFSGASPHVVAS